MAIALMFALASPVGIRAASSTLTVRTKADLRLWETVTDRSASLSWSWMDTADTARLSFSNRLTRAVSTLSVNRVPGEVRGTCPHPVPPETGEALVVATLIQYAGGAEVSRDAAELAYVPGASGRPLTVRTKAARDWWRVPHPRLSAFDARWWDVSGPSGYEVLWARPSGAHRVERAFEGVGVVDETVLWFGSSGFWLLLR